MCVTSQKLVRNWSRLERIKTENRAQKREGSQKFRQDLWAFSCLAAHAALVEHLASVFTIGHWQPKIGDPSLVGWYTVFSYYLCAGLSLASVWKGWSRMQEPDRRFRISMTVVVLFLGLSKHFNLPSAATEIGRIVAHQLGGYASRRWPQVLMLLLVIVGVILLIRWSARQQAILGIWACAAPEIICLLYLCGLFLLRVISLHQIGALFAAEIYGVRVNWIVELSGIYALIVILLTRILTKTYPGEKLQGRNS